MQIKFPTYTVLEERASVHEAGHALALLALGFRVSVSIEPEGDNVGHTRWEGTLTPRDNVLVTLAGVAAEEIVLAGCDLAGASGDLQSFDALRAAYRPGPGAAAVHLAGPDGDGLLRAAVFEARLVLRPLRKELRALARALCLRRTLSHGDAVAVVGTELPSHLPEWLQEARAADARASSAPIRHRAFDLRVELGVLQTRAAGAAEAIPVAVSSEYGVERFDAWEGERYLEVLDHSRASVDLSRSLDGLPFLLNHDTGQQIGLVENVRVGADRVLRGDVRFSRSQAAQDVRQDMLDGIRKQISVGYKPDMNNVQRTQGKKGELPAVRIMRWTPMEASTVAIPADPTVGVGRTEP